MYWAPTLKWGWLNSNFRILSHPPTVIRNYALGEEGKFVNFDTVEFAEERAFPHLFPKGDIYLNYFL